MNANSQTAALLPG